MKDKTTSWSVRTYVLALAPAVIVGAAWVGGAWLGAGQLTALIGVFLAAPTPISPLMRTLDREMDAYEEIMSAQAGVVARTRNHLWLLAASTPLSRDLRTWIGGWTLAAGALLLAWG